MLQNELGISVLKSACNSEVKDLAVDWAELGIDALLDEGVLKDAPMLGTAVRIFTTTMAIHDRIFMRKVWDFLRACPKFSDAEKETFVREHLNDPKKSQHLGDTLVLILDKLDDLEKPQLLASVFAALVRSEIGVVTFRRLVAAIDIGFLDDLRALSAHSNDTEQLVINQMVSLLRTGLSELSGPAMMPDSDPGKTRIGPVRYRLSELGKIFSKCVNK